jgi:hypothetical protein
MERIAERRHVNGWTAVVAKGDGEQFFACAFDEKEATYYSDGQLGHLFDFSDDDYADRLKDAQEAADRAVLRASGHSDCECPPWTVEATGQGVLANDVSSEIGRDGDSA